MNVQELHGELQDLLRKATDEELDYSEMVACFIMPVASLIALAALQAEVEPEALIEVVHHELDISVLKHQDAYDKIFSAR